MSVKAHLYDVVIYRRKQRDHVGQKDSHLPCHIALFSLLFKSNNFEITLCMTNLWAGHKHFH